MTSDNDIEKEKPTTNERTRNFTQTYDKLARECRNTSFFSLEKHSADSFFSFQMPIFTRPALDLHLACNVMSKPSIFLINKIQHAYLEYVLPSKRPTYSRTSIG